jgi:hypothetical protein
MSASGNQTRVDEQRSSGETSEASQSIFQSVVVAANGYQTNQAERAAMHPDGDDLEWHYYHGGWSG